MKTTRHDRKPSHLLSLLLIAALITGAGAQAASPAEAAMPAAAPHADADSPHNMCFGGLEDSKQIVHESQITNPYRETTRLGCQVDGGRPAVMPDLPAPTAQRTLMS